MHSRSIGIITLSNKIDNVWWHSKQNHVVSLIIISRTIKIWKVLSNFTNQKQHYNMALSWHFKMTSCIVSLKNGFIGSFVLVSQIQILPYFYIKYNMTLDSTLRSIGFWKKQQQPVNQNNIVNAGETNLF